MGHWTIDSDGRHEGHGDGAPRRLRPGSPRWWFTSRVTGRITVAQAPNLALVVFAAAALAGRLFHGHHQVSRILADVASGAILFWSLDELIRGVNPWRRVLGTVVLSVTLVSILRR